MGSYSFDIRKLGEICKANGVTIAGVFGSMARGEAFENRGIDFLVRLAR